VSKLEELDQESGLSLCRFRIGNDVFGMETSVVQEALDSCELREVPRAPKFVAGVVAYRGEVLLAISFRALLGISEQTRVSSAVVLRDTETGELFALLLDELLDVVEIADNVWEPNPATLDERHDHLFSGVYRISDAPVVRLEPERLQPSRLMRQHNARPRMGEQR